MLARTLLVLAGLATTVLGFSWFVEGHHAVGAYRHAPVCGTAEATPGKDCALHETGKVTAGKVDHGDNGATYRLTVARETAPKRTYTVGEAFYDDVEVGTDVELTLFRGRVAEVSYHGHRAQNPITPWLTALKVALLAGLGSALTAHGLAGWRPGARSIPASVGALVVFLSLLGSLVFMATQWPLAVTLGIPVLGWLALTAGSTSASRDG
ncbi:hypothetical protein ACGFZP_17295 [Kitasatospora sp. NPDC048239]|uniref:hypothetical protein n=1 Tax=Kitasatospora sp. NPDC048239 TaxID=3364046 RepID=UPI0037171110